MQQQPQPLGRAKEGAEIVEGDVAEDSEDCQTTGIQGW